MNNRDKKAIGAIILIAICLEIYRPLGLALAFLAIVAMLFRLSEMGEI